MRARARAHTHTHTHTHETKLCSTCQRASSVDCSLEQKRKKERVYDSARLWPSRPTVKIAAQRVAEPSGQNEFNGVNSVETVENC